MEGQFRINWQAIVEEAKQRRKEQKITQKKLAAFAEVSTPTVSRFESGEENIEMSSVLKILEVLGMADLRRLTFSKPKEKYDPSRMAVIFFGHDAKKEITCAMSFEALDDHFGLVKDPIKTFISNRDRIENEARKKYFGNRLERDGLVLIRTEDL